MKHDFQFYEIVGEIEANCDTQCDKSADKDLTRHASPVESKTAAAKMKDETASQQKETKRKNLYCPRLVEGQGNDAHGKKPFGTNKVYPVGINGGRSCTWAGISSTGRDICGSLPSVREASSSKESCC